MKHVEEIESDCKNSVVDLVNERLVKLRYSEVTVQFVELYGNNRVVAYLTIGDRDKR